MAFPMDKVFDESWGNHWVETIGNFFRYFHFSLWSQERFSGKLILRFGYEDDCHEHSQKIFDFFNCKAPINYVKME